MIKCEDGHVTIEGENTMIFAEFMCIVNAINEAADESKERLAALLKHFVDVAVMDEEELDEEQRKLREEQRRLNNTMIIDYIPADQCTKSQYICCKCGECGRKFENGYLVDDGDTTVTEETEEENE